MINENSKIFLKQDVFLPLLKEYGFEYIKNEKKECYKGSGYEVECDTREIKSTSKCNLALLLLLYNNNLLDIVNS